MSTSLKSSAAEIFGAEASEERLQFVRARKSEPRQSETMRRGESTFAAEVSRALQGLGLGLKRKGTEDSEMSFGFTDVAPEGVMEGCERCERPISGKEVLKRGLCGGCWGEVGGRGRK